MGVSCLRWRRPTFGLPALEVVSNPVRSNSAAHADARGASHLGRSLQSRAGGRERYVPMRPLRSFVFATWLLPLSAYAADKVCAPQSMIKAVTSIEAPDLPP